MSASAVAVRITDTGWRASLPGASAVVRRAAEAALEGRDAALTALLTSDRRMRRLNAAFRGKDAPTNILAFPPVADAGDYLGDIALGLGICRAESVDQGKSLADHVRHLVVHGVLHLRGFDHDDAGAAARMEAVERALLAAMHVADPYGEESPGDGDES